jgi:hypothetical protein
MLETLCNWTIYFKNSIEVCNHFHRDLLKLSKNDEIFILNGKLVYFFFHMLRDYKNH